VDFAPVRSVSVPFLTKWCWNSVCLLCWSDDHGTLFELHGKTNGKSAQHPWWHQGLLVEHLQNNKTVNYWLRKVAMWAGGQRLTKMSRHFCKMDPFLTSGHIYPFPLCTPTLSSKINVEFKTLESFFYCKKHGFGVGGRGFKALRLNRMK